MSIPREEISPFACDMTAIEPSERTGHHTAIREVFQAVQSIEERSDGYRFRLPNESSVILKVAEFISKERLCCPFFGFTVEIEPEGGPLWLDLMGREGVKPFIMAEIGGAVNETTARPVSWQNYERGPS